MLEVSFLLQLEQGSHEVAVWKNSFSEGGVVIVLKDFFIDGECLQLEEVVPGIDSKQVVYFREHLGLT